MYKAKGVSEAGFLLHQNTAGLEGVAVEDLEEWEVLVMVGPYEESQKEPMEFDYFHHASIGSFWLSS